jgi:hypothetical protein
MPFSTHVSCFEDDYREGTSYQPYPCCFGVAANAAAMRLRFLRPLILANGLQKGITPDGDVQRCFDLCMRHHLDCVWPMLR